MAYELVEKIRKELEKEFGHEPSQRILAMMDGKRWKTFWKRYSMENNNVTGKRN